MLFDALSMRFKELKLRKDPQCPVSGENPTVTELIDYEEFCGVGRGNEAGAPAASTESGANGAQPAMQEITARELKARMDRGDQFTLIDVREPHEYEIARIPGAKLIPLGQISQRADTELDPDEDIVLQCKGGVRSAQALAELQAKGYKRLTNLKGGILAWSDDVDPSVPKY